MTRLVERGRAPHILLVEDNSGDVFLFRRAISRFNSEVEVTVAGTAVDALESLRLVSMDDTGSLPDLIVTDLNLPGLNGLEFLQKIKTDAGLRRIPCVVLSSSSASSEIESAYDAHANGYLTKPTSADEYARMITELASYWFALMHTPPASARDLMVASRNGGFCSSRFA